MCRIATQLADVSKVQQTKLPLLVAFVLQQQIAETDIVLAVRQLTVVADLTIDYG